MKLKTEKNLRKAQKYVDFLKGIDYELPCIYPSNKNLSFPKQLRENRLTLIIQYKDCFFKQK